MEGRRISGRRENMYKRRTRRSSEENEDTSKHTKKRKISQVTEKGKKRDLNVIMKNTNRNVEDIRKKRDMRRQRAEDKIQDESSERESPNEAAVEIEKKVSEKSNGRVEKQCMPGGGVEDVPNSNNGNRIESNEKDIGLEEEIDGIEPLNRNVHCLTRSQSLRENSELHEEAMNEMIMTQSRLDSANEDEEERRTVNSINELEVMNEREEIGNDMSERVTEATNNARSYKPGSRRHSTSMMESNRERRNNRWTFEELEEECETLHRTINNMKVSSKEKSETIHDLKMRIHAMDIQLNELNKENVNLKIMCQMLKKENGKEEEKERGKGSVNFKRSKTGRRVYENTVEFRFGSIVEAVREKIRRFTVLEVLEMDESGGESNNENKEAVTYYNWSGRTDETGGPVSSGTIAISEEEDEKFGKGLVGQCPLRAVMLHGMFSPSKENVMDRIKMMANAAIETDIGKPIRDAQQTKKCITQICGDRAIIAEYKSRIANALGCRKKAVRNRFSTLLGYTMLSTRFTKSEKMSHGQSEERRKQFKEFEEKVSIHAKKDNIDFSWWRTINSAELCFSELIEDCRKEAMDEEDALFSNQIGRSVYEEYMNHNFKMNHGDESSIASLARVDVWISLIAKFVTLEREKGQSIQKLYSDAQNKYLPLAVQQILMKARNAVKMQDENELTLRMCATRTEGDKFNNNMRDATKVVRMTSLSKTYIVVQGKWFYENYSKGMGFVLDCYVGKFDSIDTDELEDSELSEEISMSTM